MHPPGDQLGQAALEELRVGDVGLVFDLVAVEFVRERQQAGLVLQGEVEQIAFELMLALRAFQDARADDVEAHELLRGGSLLDPDALCAPEILDEDALTRARVEHFVDAPVAREASAQEGALSA